MVAQPVPTKQTYRILVVDDDENMRDLLKLMVTQVGCEAIEVDRAKDALDHIEKGHAHMMLLDLQMPGASGLDLLRSMRRHRVWVPTVVVSGFISPDAAKQLAQLGVQGMVAKPFTKERVLGEIQKVIGNSG
jgi:DNA-binding NtrC family response regulator